MEITDFLFRLVTLIHLCVFYINTDIYRFIIQYIYIFKYMYHKQAYDILNKQYINVVFFPSLVLHRIILPLLKC